MTVLIDTTALFALLDVRDEHHVSAVRHWDLLEDEDLVAHSYVVVETVALARARLGWPAVHRLVDEVLPALRVEMVDRELHDSALMVYRRLGGGTSFVDRVTIAFGQREGIRSAFAFDRDLEASGLAFPSS